MRDSDCVDFLRWALPRLGLRWAGYARVRGQVCKRLGRRLAALGLADLAAYRRRLDAEPGEWAALDGLCRVTVSRFYRDRATFAALGRQVLPGLAEGALARGESALCCWSAGCASGEEPYTLVILWSLEIERRYPGLAMEIVATDAGPAVLARARAGRYARGSLRELPAPWLAAAFEENAGKYAPRATPGAACGSCRRLGSRRRSRRTPASTPSSPASARPCASAARTFAGACRRVPST